MIKLQNVTKQFGVGNAALDDVSFSIERGDFVFIVGPSGSGKTTLFRLLIRDMMPTNGSLSIGEWDLVSLPNKKVSQLRKRIGVVFQDLKLFRDRTIFENIAFPLEVVNTNQQETRRRVEELLEQVGIAEHRDKFPVQLSGGELQRAAIARALAFSPEILLADEPTGNLDSTTSWEIVKLLQDINQSGTTVLMATHNTDIVNSLLKRIIGLEKGKLVRDEQRNPQMHTAQSKKEEEPKKEKE